MTTQSDLKSRFDAIVKDAYRFHLKTLEQRGVPSSTYEVSYQDYKVLVWEYNPLIHTIISGAGDGEITLCGMTVIPTETPCNLVIVPHVERWVPGAAVMQHLRWIELDSLGAEMCRTVWPADIPEVAACPCGEIIWEMPRGLGISREIRQERRPTIAQVDSDDNGMSLEDWTKEVDQMLGEMDHSEQDMNT